MSNELTGKIVINKEYIYEAQKIVNSLLVFSIQWILKVDVRNETIKVKVIRKILRAIATNFILTQPIGGEDWRKTVNQNFLQPSSTMTAEELNDFILIDSKLYLWCNGGILARTIFGGEAKEELKRVHSLSCGNNNRSLYRRQ